MPNTLLIPILNPASFRRKTQEQLPQYLSKHYEDFLFASTIENWQSPACYVQKVQTSDTLHFQFTSTFAPVQMQVIDSDGRVYLTQSASRTLQNRRQPQEYAYQFALNMAPFEQGIYYLYIPVIDAISEPLFVKPRHEGTLLFEYSHDKFHEDVLPTGISFTFRVEGRIGFINPKSADQYYTDQKNDPVLLSSKVYKTFNLSIGGSYGIPDWVVDKINYIFSCNNVLIDGKPYAKAPDATFEMITDDPYPMRGIRTTIQPGINRGSKLYTPIDTDLYGIGANARQSVVYDIDGSVFGDLSTNASSNIITITDVE